MLLEVTEKQIPFLYPSQRFDEDSECGTSEDYSTQNPLAKHEQVLTDFKDLTENIAC